MSDALVIVCGAGPLARARADELQRELEAAWPESELKIEIVPCGGADAGLGEIEASRQAVVQGRAHVAVNAYDRLPLAPLEGLRIAAVPMRADPRDVIVTRSGKVLQYLPEGSRIGSSFGRRSGQLLRRRSDLVAVAVAGDPLARLARLDSGDFDGILLAAADLLRLGLRERITQYFDHDQMIPAPAQGALAIEIRQDDRATADRLAPLNDPLTAYAIEAERACLARLGAEPGAPAGIHAITDGEQMAIFGIVLSEDGTRTARMQWSGPSREAHDLGETLAELLISIGADKILSGADIPPTMRYSFQPGGRAEDDAASSNGQPPVGA